MNVDKNSLWIVEYNLPNRDDYRVYRFAEPENTVAYEDYWQDAVNDIVANYGNDVKIILIKKWDGSVDYRTYGLV